MDTLAIKFLKNYQVWHHRRLLLGALRESALKEANAELHLRALNKHELAFVADALDADEKNYHTWSYRQWILMSSGDEAVWTGELPFIERLLTQDIRNNSAWHHRFFVVWASGVRQGDEDRREVLRRELT
jgi:protein farnesyltransferase/geranylgeranyltransferase type-1 subunit alpha